MAEGKVKYFEGSIGDDLIRLFRRADGSIAIDGFLAGSANLFEDLGEEDASPLKFDSLSMGQYVCLGLDNSVSRQIVAPLEVVALGRTHGFATLTLLPA